MADTAIVADKATYLKNWYLENKARHRAKATVWNGNNRDRINARRRQLRIENPESLRKEHAREKRYRTKLTAEQRRERCVRKSLWECPEAEIQKALSAWVTFDGVCQGCGERCSIKYDTDHCHVTKKFRGILGSKCNKVLGLVSDFAVRLQRLSSYLERSSCE